MWLICIFWHKFCGFGSGGGVCTSECIGFPAEIYFDVKICDGKWLRYAELPFILYVVRYKGRDIAG